MRLTLGVSLSALMALVIAEGYLHFDVERRTSNTSSPRLGRRATNPINAQLSANLRNLQEYIINLSVGTPGQSVGVTLDTGSSDLWIPSSSFCRTKQCDFGSFSPSRSSTYKLIDQNGFNITYAAPGDSDAGDWVSDSVSLGGAPAVRNQTFGLANNGYDSHGVLGIGFDTHTTNGPNGANLYNTVIDNMAQEGLISRKAYSIYLNTYNQTKGSIVFGGVDTTKYTGNLVGLPLQPGPNGKTTEFFVTLSKVTFTDAAGSDTVLTPDGYSQAVLLDTGTSYSALTNDLVVNIARGMGAQVTDGGGNLGIPCNYNNTNATLSWTFGGPDGVTIKVPVADTIGASYGTYCLFGFGTLLNGGVSILGDTVLRNTYAVFDIDNRVAALAQAKPGQAGISSIIAFPSGTSIPGVSSTATARGTQLTGAAATRSANLPTASYSDSQIVPTAPTFNLGAAATASMSSSVPSTMSTSTSTSTRNAAVRPLMTGLPQVALLGAGLVAGGLIL